MRRRVRVRLCGQGRPEVYFGLWALDLPVIFAAVIVPLGELRNDGEASLECKNGGSYDDQPTCAQASQK